MRWISLAVMLVALFAITFLTAGEPKGCGSPVRVIVSITAQPQGGTNVNQLSCTFTAELDGGEETTTRTVKAVWVNQQGTEYDPQTYTISHEDGAKSFTTTKSAPAGMFLDKTFHVKLTWEDDGDSQTLESESAACTVQ